MERGFEGRAAAQQRGRRKDLGAVLIQIFWLTPDCSFKTIVEHSTGSMWRVTMPFTDIIAVKVDTPGQSSGRVVINEGLGEPDSIAIIPPCHLCKSCRGRKEDISFCLWSASGGSNSVS